MNTHRTVRETDHFSLNVQECLRVKLPSQEMGSLTYLRNAARLGQPLPVQIFHSLEVLGHDLDYVHNVEDVNGVFGGSPAATIAMLTHTPMQQRRSIAFIEEMAARLGGALPVATQLDTFERAWIFHNLLQAGIPLPTHLIRAAAQYFTACLGLRGASFTPGQMPDADNSAMVLCILNALGYSAEPRCLLTYEGESCFCCYDRERNPSVSTNAHVLEAFGNYLMHTQLSVPKYHNAITKISTYLLSVQRQDGSWIDKWHASPYYATQSTLLALQRFGVGDTVTALNRAIAWILQTQRNDGSWGHWCGTLEETAYALQILLLTKGAEDAEIIEQVAKRGLHFLIQHLNAPPDDAVHMQLWHGKELYKPRRIVRAVILSALYLCAITLSNIQRVGQESPISWAA